MSGVLRIRKRMRKTATSINRIIKLPYLSEGHCNEMPSIFLLLFIESYLFYLFLQRKSSIKKYIFPNSGIIIDRTMI